VRGELNGRNVEGCVRAAILTGDGGDGGAAVESAEGEAVATLQTVSDGRHEEGRARGCIGVVRGRVGHRDGRTAGGDGGGTLLNGVAAGTQWRGGRGVERRVGRSGGERGGPRHGGKWLRWPALAPGRWRCRVTVAGGGTRAAQTQVSDRRFWATVGPGGH
jgi:hypothetical protein